jgi:hypothetical protein
MKTCLSPIVIILCTLLAFSLPAISAAKSDCTQSECNEEIKQLTKFAKNGSPHAMAMLGVFYFHGEGIKQDYKKAAKWLQHASKKDSPQARYYLSLMYRQGLHYKQDIDKANWYLTRSSNGGFVLALVDKGVESYLAAQESSSTEEFVQAYQYFVQAAALNSIKASYLLAKMTEQGIGTSIDTAKASSLFALAASKDYRDSKSHLIRLTGSVEQATKVEQNVIEQNKVIFPESTMERIEVVGNKITMATHLQFIISDIKKQKVYSRLASGSTRLGKGCDKWSKPTCGSITATDELYPLWIEAAIGR